MPPGRTPSEWGYAVSILSVDLGTSNTVAVLAAHGRPARVVEVDGSAAMPSAVFASEDGRLIVGKEAERRARLDPARFEPNPKRRVDEGTLLLGDRVVPVTEAFAAVLRAVAEETSRQLSGARPDEVRLTHPAQWGPVRRNVLLSAARQAGLGLNLVLVPEPVAAVAHFASFPGRALTQGQALAVYDLGAGTFDVAVVSGQLVVAESGLADLGGLDVDEALLTYVGRQVSHRDPHGWHRLLRPRSTADRRTQRALREDVRAAKEALSGHPQTEVPLPEPFGDVLVTRAELETLIRPSLLRSVELLNATVLAAGLARDGLAGVYLVGGSSRIPLVAAMIAEQLGIVPTNLDQPETAVAFGAHHVSPEGTSLRTENLPDTTPPPPAAGPPPPPRAATAPMTAPPPPRQAAPPGLAAPPPAEAPWGERPAPGTRAARTLWVIGATALAALVLLVVVVNLPRGGRGDSAVAGQATAQTPPSTQRTTSRTTSFSPTPTTTDAGDVAVGHPKAVKDETDCAGLLTTADISAALASPTRPSASGDPCYFAVEFPGTTDTSLLSIRITPAEPYRGTRTDYEGNTAYEYGEDITVISTDGGGGDAPHCEVSISLDPDESLHDEAAHWLAVDITGDPKQQPPVDLCDAMWTLAKTAFAKLPDA